MSNPHYFGGRKWCLWLTKVVDTFFCEGREQEMAPIHVLWIFVTFFSCTHSGRVESVVLINIAFCSGFQYISACYVCLNGQLLWKCSFILHSSLVYDTAVLHFPTLKGLSAKSGAQWHAIAFFISSVYETLPAVSLLGIASHTLPGCHKDFSEDGGNPHYLFNPSRPLGVMKRCFEVTSCDLIKLISKGTTSQIDEIIGWDLPFGPIHAWNEIQNYSDLVQVDDLDLKLN